jgi:hypothetical protein
MGDIEMIYYMNVRIWEPIPQFDRTRRYEAPLQVALRANKLGEITGRGAQMSMELEIEFVEIDLALDKFDEAVDLIKCVLEEAGAPAGSEIRFENGSGLEVIPFGTKEGLAIYLDGVNLPDAVYEKCNINELASMIFGGLSSVGGEIRGSWVGRNETSLYIYGPSAEAIYETIEPILVAYPLCQNARIVIRHGNPKLEPRTVRLPRHEGTNGAKLVFWGGKTGSG